MMSDYKYITIPKTISFNDIAQNNYCFAPSKYSKFAPNSKVNYQPLANLCVESKEKTSKINKQDKYFYSEIGDIDVNNGLVNVNSFYGIGLPSDNPKSLKQGDILISTVRTYRGGVGFIYDNLTNHCSTPAVLVIRDLKTTEITKEYLFAVLRTEFFIEQILGFQNRGMYPRLDSEAMNNVLIPIPKIKKEVEYITALTKAYLNKINLIKQRHEKILQLIEDELMNNQKSNRFVFNLPNIGEIEKTGRLDTGVYSETFKKIKFYIENYQEGTFYINENNIRSGSTPETRYISFDKKLLFQWITPTHCSDYGTLMEERINLVGDNNIKDDCILLINRTSKGGVGEYVGIAGFYNYQDLGGGHHNQGMYRVFDYEKYQLIFMLAFLNCSIMRKYCANLSVGSKMKELKIEQFLQIPFPNFPTTKQQEIAKLYHNPIDYPTATFTLENFLTEDSQYNEQAGIYELDKTAKQLQNLLNQAIENIINDKPVTISFPN